MAIRIYLLLGFLLLLRIIVYFAFEVPKYQIGSEIALVGTLGQEPTYTLNRQNFRLNNLLVTTAPFLQFHFGDRLKVTGRLSCLTEDESCPTLVLRNPQIDLIAKDTPSPWSRLAIFVRDKFVETYQDVLPKRQADLLAGVVLGGTSAGLDRSFKTKLANVGLTHVVAASGMNISLFSGFVIFISSLFRVRKILKATLIIVSILFYATVTGFEPPVVRAALMAVLALVATLLGRQGSGFWGLALSAYLMLWAVPPLLTSASFLLSFSAMAGQIYVSTVGFELPKHSRVIIEPLIKLIIQCLAAIVATFPFVVIFFAKFSLISLFTNLLVLWTVEPLMILGGLAGIVGLVSLDLAQLVALPATALLNYFLWVVDVFGRQDLFLLRLPRLDWTFIFGYYLLLAAAILWWHQRKQAAKAAPVTQD